MAVHQIDLVERAGPLPPPAETYRPGDPRQPNVITCGCFVVVKRADTSNRIRLRVVKVEDDGFMGKVTSFPGHRGADDMGGIAIDDEVSFREIHVQRYDRP